MRLAFRYPMKFFPRLATLGLLSALFVSSLLANTAVEPAPRDDKWVKRHEGFAATAKAGNIDVLFLGDSITDFWVSTDASHGGKAVWDREFAKYHVANFGISGDRTQHVLWRLRNGEGEGFSPKVVVLLIGTNNTGLERDNKTVRNNTSESIEGTKAVIAEVRKDFPAAKILLHALFPRGYKTDTPEQQKQVDDINAAIQPLADGKQIVWIDLRKKLSTPDGQADATLMPDKLHPNEKGYELWADAIRGPIADALKDAPAATKKP